jgi:nicotinamidase-related amidase
MALYDPSHTALIVIDLQEAILRGERAPYPAADILARSVAIGRQLKAGGGTLVMVHVAWAEDFADTPKGQVDSSFPRPASAKGSDGSAIAPDLVALGPQLVLTKKSWGAFAGPELDTQLRRRGIDTVIVTGIATNFGVESTVREAWPLNYSVIVAEDACGSMSAELHAFAVRNIFTRLARVRSTAELLANTGV